MEIREFYKKYNLNRYYFARMAHVGTGTLVKYEQGKPIRDDARSRIETAMRLVEEHDLVRPRHMGGFNSFYYNDYFHAITRDYMEKFETLLKGA